MYGNKLRKEDKAAADNFYGVQAPVIEGLQVEVRHGCRKGQNYDYLVYLNDWHGKLYISWKIVPTVTPKNRVHSLHLLDGSGRQIDRTWGTPKGVKQLTRFIRDGGYKDEFHRRGEMFWKRFYAQYTESGTSGVIPSNQRESDFEVASTK